MQGAYEDFTLLVDGKNAFPEIIRCIENARRSVYINMFIWRDDAIGNRMAQAVLAAADKGARVYVSVDRYGVVLEKAEECKRSFFHKKTSLTEKLKIRALELLYPMKNAPRRAKDEETELYKALISHPNVTVSRDVFKADHSKYYIIDDEILFLGGINIEDKENGSDMQGREYGDYMAKLAGAEYVAAFRAKLNDGVDVSQEYFFGANIKGEKRRFEMEARYLEMIDSARERLHITMAYFTPLAPFVDALVRAHERDVHITLILPEHANYQDDSNRRTACKLLKATDGGIEVFFSPKMLHTKLMINDDLISFGSTNITKKAFGQLDELNLFVKNTDSTFRDTLMESVEADMRGAKRVNHYREIKYNRLLAFLEGFIV